MAWVILVVAGLFEVAWAFALKQSHGFSRLGPTVIFIVTMTISVALLAWAMRSLPLGTAYVIWTGIGAVGAFLAGILFLGESASMMRIIAAILIIAGLGLMRFATPG
jgi:quaternary ammonium compound-resistance protein SugE